MKKTRIFSMVFAIGLLGLIATGCSSPSNPAVEQNNHNAKSGDLIKFNIKDAKYLATQWADQVSQESSVAAYIAREAAAAAGEEAETSDEKAENPFDSLVAVVEGEGGELEQETVMEIPEVVELAAWCVPQPVRELYSCPYDTAEAKAKGVYTVFAWWIDWWKYTDDTPAPNVGQIMYVKPDGTSVDILNKDNDVHRHLCTWIKEYDGEDYIQFDEYGNIFMLVEEEDTNEYAIYRYNPLSDEITSYKLDVGTKNTAEIRNFKVTKDGKWIFMNVMVNKVQNNVYAMKVNSNDKPITMYEFKAKQAPKEATWAVSSIGVNPLTNNVYWYVDEYTDELRPNSGLYVAKKKGDGYSKENITRHCAIGYWDLISVIEHNVTGNKDGTIPKPATPDYQSVLDYIKHAGGYDDSYQFDLSYFKDKTEVDVIDYEGKETKMDFSGLYKADAEGKVLTDLDAIKYIIDTKYKDAYGTPDWATDPDEETTEWLNRPLFIGVLNDFFLNYWCEPYTEPGKNVLSGIGGYKDAGYALPFSADGLYVQPVFPFEIFMHNKEDPKDSFAMSEVYLKSKLARNYNGIIVSNDDGTWLLNDVWSSTSDDNDYALAFRLADEDGILVCDQPGKLADLQLKPRWTKETSERESTDPWYKKPVAASNNVIAALDNDKKTIWYHTGNTTVDLREKDTTKIQFIYSFTLLEDQLIYNAVKSSGGYVMVSIDLKTKEATKLPIEKRSESMLGL